MAILKKIKSIFTTALSWVKNKLTGLTAIQSILKTILEKVKKWGPIALSAALAAIAGIEHVRRVKAEKREAKAVSKAETAERKAGSAEIAMEAQSNLISKQNKIAKEKQEKSKKAAEDRGLYNDIAGTWNKGGKE